MYNPGTVRYSESTLLVGFKWLIAVMNQLICKIMVPTNLQVVFLFMPHFSFLQASIFGDFGISMSVICLFYMFICLDSEEPMSLEEKDHIVCSHCIFNSTSKSQEDNLDVEKIFSNIEVNDVNCSFTLPLLSCSYCNYSYQCQDGYCKQFTKVHR